MITLITGVPGAGKTAAAVDLIIKEYKDRPLYVDGLEGLSIAHESVDALEWHDEVPDGAVVVVDEVQRRWRPRGPGSKVPPSVAALETHRHRGIDFVIITQSPKLVDSNVRGLVGRHVHIRDTGFLGRWAYEWPETNIDLAYRNCQNKRRYVLPKKVFQLYKSASMHVKPVRKAPPMVYIAGALLVALVVLGGFAYKKFGGAVVPQIATAMPSATTMPQLPVSGMGAGPRPADAVVGPPNELIDFIPRIGGRPWTAPAYDNLRRVVRMPQIAGAICTSERCVCVSDSGERLDVSDTQCRDWLTLPTFNPYREPVNAAAPGRPAPVVSPVQPVDSVPAAGSVLPAVTGYSNPRADSRWTNQ